VFSHIVFVIYETMTNSNPEIMISLQ